MAIIKCPECGHQISDKAPVCPNCGIEIAGKIIKCANCGHVYFKEEGSCPICHTTNKDVKTDIQIPHQLPDITEIYLENGAETAPTTFQRGQTSLPQKHGNVNEHDSDGKKSGKVNKTILIVSLVVAVVIIGVCLFFYMNAKSNREQEEYAYALSSNDIEISKEYLDNFKDAPQTHIDSVTTHMQALIRQNQDWTNAVVSGSKTVLAEFLNTYPDSPYAKEAVEKIDSIDWEQCIKQNTPDAYQTYIDEHPDGIHRSEASELLNKLKANELSPEERLTISNIFRDFFIGINTRNESTLTAHIGEYINFLEKQNATRNDVVSFMNKLYKDNVESMVWSIPGSYEIKKEGTDDGLYKYDATFMAEQKVNSIDGTETTNLYRITATVNPDGKITEMSMVKIVE